MATLELTDAELRAAIKAIEQECEKSDQFTSGGFWEHRVNILSLREKLAKLEREILYAESK